MCLNRLSFTIFLIFFFVQKSFNFVLNKLLNPFIFAFASETILEHFFLEWFAQSVHACFDLRKYFRIFNVQKDLHNPIALVLSSETILEYFCREGFTRSIQVELVLNGFLNLLLIFFVLKNLLNH